MPLLPLLTKFPFQHLLLILHPHEKHTDCNRNITPQHPHPPSGPPSQRGFRNPTRRHGIPSTKQRRDTKPNQHQPRIARMLHPTIHTRCHQMIRRREVKCEIATESAVRGETHERTEAYQQDARDRWDAPRKQPRVEIVRSRTHLRHPLGCIDGQRCEDGMVSYGSDGDATDDGCPRACDEADPIRLVSVFAVGGWIGGRGAERAEVARPHHSGGESCGACLSHFGECSESSGSEEGDPGCFCVGLVWGRTLK